MELIMLYLSILKQILCEYTICNDLASNEEVFVYGKFGRVNEDVKINWYLSNDASEEELKEYPSSRWTTLVQISFHSLDFDDDQSVCIRDPHKLSLPDLKEQVLDILQNFDLSDHWRGYNCHGEDISVYG